MRIIYLPDLDRDSLPTRAQLPPSRALPSWWVVAAFGVVALTWWAWGRVSTSLVVAPVQTQAGNPTTAPTAAPVQVADLAWLPAGYCYLGLYDLPLPPGDTVVGSTTWRCVDGKLTQVTAQPTPATQP
jgi:hypothetical protein